MGKTGFTYTGDNTAYIAFPVGGIGAGMFCLQGNGKLGQFSLKNHPDMGYEPNIFAALYIKQSNMARVLEGPVAGHKLFGSGREPGLGQQGKNYGLPRFASNDFTARFPFADIALEDEAIPLKCSIHAFSPFIPNDADHSGLPAGTLEYRFENPTQETVDGVFYFSSQNFFRFDKDHMSWGREGNHFFVHRNGKGFTISQGAVAENDPEHGEFAVAVTDADAVINTDWFDGGWFDIITMQWKDIKNGVVRDGHQKDNKSPGGSAAVRFTLRPGESKAIPVHFAWHFPCSDLKTGECDETYAPWYSGRFANAAGVMGYYIEKYDELYEKTRRFTDSLFASTLPPELIEAVSANLSILKSPTLLRQTDGRLWAWEGCGDTSGSCPGSCTHVWNYAQAICHLFPSLERSLRQTEFYDSQNGEGHQQFRAMLPIRPAIHDYHAASDGQLGGIMKMHREWCVSGDTAWLAGYWEKMRSSMEYCIRTWDKKEEGVLKEPHHNTYDIEFWGADGMCSSFYLGALRAMMVMGEALGADVSRYRRLYEAGSRYLEERLFNGEYFIQEVEWQTLEATLDLTGADEHTRVLLESEGPKYQYGNGCLSDGILGAWMAKMCGLGEILDPEKVKSHLLSVYRYNFKRTLEGHDNPQRPGYANGREGGLLLCSWPRHDKPSLPFVYSDEVWTGIEYQVASHLISYGLLEEGLEIVRTCRARYDGTVRNPFNEYECGHWYGRALASYSLIQAYTGVRYSVVDRTLYVKEQSAGAFQSFFAAESGYGLVCVDGDEVEFQCVEGSLPVWSVVLEK